MTGMIESALSDFHGSFAHVCDMRPNIHMEYDTATARLIAAAPDLLEALRGLINCQEDPEFEDEYRGSPHDNAMRQARAAIAKAEGRG